MGSEYYLTEIGPISKDFTRAKLLDLCTDKSGVQTGPFGSQLHKDDYVEVGTPIITVEHLGNNLIEHNTETPMVSDEDKERLKKFQLREGDIVFSRVGSVDRRAYVSSFEDGWLFSGRCLRVRVDKNKIHPKYLSYFFGYEGFKKYIRGIAVGATMPSINTKILSDIVVYFPSFNSQVKIAEYLSSIDRKIQLNREINQTLEQMAQVLFKSWFVDFDPVIDNALDAGNPIPDALTERAARRQTARDSDDFQPLPDDVRQLFPSEFEDSELGWIPKGWGVNSLLTQVKVSSGKRPPIKSDIKTATETVPVWGGNGIKWYTNEHLFDTKYIITGRVGTLGTVYKVSGLSWASDNTLIIQPFENNLYEYIYHCLMNFDLQSLNSGSTQPLITQKALKDIKILTCNKEALYGRFQAITSSMSKKINGNNLESLELEKLRDTLLPKLISGELRLDSAEVEQAKSLLDGE
jgi:type I restriction enzyme S subunit